MGANRMMKTPCKILRREKVDENEYGDAVLKEVELETVCALQQSRRDEHDQGGELSDTLSDLYLPIDTQIDTGDAVQVKGRKYEVVGEPWAAEEGSRSLWHVEATVRRTAGTDEGDAS